MITCKCCGESKATHAFSWNHKSHIYSPNCRECGLWLRLFREVFGPTRDWQKNLENTKQRSRDKRNAPVHNLFEAWGIRRPTT